MEEFKTHILDFKQYLKDKDYTKKTIRLYLQGIKLLIELYEETGDLDINAFIKREARLCYSKDTAGRHLGGIRKYFKWLIENGYATENPTNGIDLKGYKPSRKNPKLEYLTNKEMDAMTMAPDDSPSGLMDRAILEIMFTTGSVHCEISRITLDDVDFFHNTITIKRYQNKPSTFPITPSLREALRDYIEKSRIVGTDFTGGEYPLFVNSKENFLKEGRIRVIANRYKRKINLDCNLTAQIIKKSVAIRLLGNGIELKEVMELLGIRDFEVATLLRNYQKENIRLLYNHTYNY